MNASEVITNQRNILMEFLFGNETLNQNWTGRIVRKDFSAWANGQPVEDDNESYDLLLRRLLLIDARNEAAERTADDGFRNATRFPTKLLKIASVEPKYIKDTLYMGRKDLPLKSGNPQIGLQE